MESWRVFHSSEWGKCQLKTIIAVVVMMMFTMFFYRWIIAIKASIKKWLPLHQALRDYLNQPPEETRMWGSVLCEYWQQPTSPCGSLDESPVCPLFPVLPVCQRRQYHSGKSLLCRSTVFTRSGDKVVFWALLARLQVMHLWLNHSGSDQSVSYEEPLATIGMV